MSKNNANEALWRLAVEIESKENEPASKKDCSEIRVLRERFSDLLHQKSREAKACREQIELGRP